MNKMTVKLKERRFRCAPSVSTGLFEAVENEGVSSELLPQPRWVTQSRLRKLWAAGVALEFEDNKPKE